ncbi:GLUG motif-containing protein [Pseudoprevotella muciniphila]|nr:GLUG motif-containing protein [Pseudoprevotella muciniphila]
MTRLHNLMRTLILTVLAAALPSAAWAQFGGGSGRAESPYIISTTDHMDYLATQVNAGYTYRNKYFLLANDLDYAGKTYNVIGRYVKMETGGASYYFQGIFDGGGHTIRNVTIDAGAGSWADDNAYIALFGNVGPSAEIKNLTLGGTSTFKARKDVGGIVGSADGSETSWIYIGNCHVESGVTIEPSEPYNNENIGGIVGWGNCCIIENCTSAATVTAHDELSHFVGGIVGRIYGKARIENCVNSGSVSGNYAVGGIVGKIDNGKGTDLNIKNNVNVASVTGNLYAGGVVGMLDGNATLTGNAVGGACTIGALGVENSTQGTDTGIDVTHLYTVHFLSYIDGEIASQPTKTIGGTNYYAAGTPITLTGLYTSGTPVVDGYNKGTMWNFQAYIDVNNYVEVMPQEDGTWRFTMPAANVSIVSQGVKDIRYEDSPNYTRVKLTPASASYTGTSQKPTVGVTCRSRDLTEGTDFVTDIPAEGFKEVGKHPFRIWGIGAYGGLRTDTFVIERAPLTNLTLNETSVYHDGAAHKPALTVKAGNKTLAVGTEYQTDLPNQGFTDLGVYTIKVWGVGNYTDTLTATYTVCHPWEGMGTYNEPFLIKTTDDMNRLATLVNGGKTYEGVYFRQVNDLDFTGKTYTPVGNADNRPFQGTYNGDFRTMTGINVSGGNYVGVFGHVGSQGTVRHVSLTGTNSFSGDYVAGSIAGRNSGTIEWCNMQTGANVSVSAADFGGGIVGANYGTINVSDNRANVTAKCAGGIAGLNSNNGTINGMNYATITGYAYCGGIVGENESGTISGQHLGSVNCTNSYGHCGGIVGDNFAEGIVEYSLSNDLMTAVVVGTSKGAIAGRNDGTLTSNYYIGNCKFKGLGNENNDVSTDVTTQAMRGWPISTSDAIYFSPIPDASDNIVGTYYDDGTNNYYYVGAGETLRFVLYGGINYTANGTPLAVAGYDDNYGDDYYELTMTAAPVHIAPVGLTLTLYDKMVNLDNAGYIAAADGEQRDVTIDGRTLYKDGEWNTLCLPFAIDDLTGTPLEGATIMELDTDGTNGLDPATGTLHLTFKDTTAIAAGKPYIIKWTSGTDITDPVFKGVTVNAAQPAEVTAQSAGYGAVTFKGTYMFPWVSAYDKTQLFLTTGDKLVYPTEERRLMPFRAWFVVDGSIANNVRGFSLDFDNGNQSVTGINGAEPLKGDTKQSAIYDLQGRRVAQPQKGGIYIINGKKVVY